MSEKQFNLNLNKEELRLVLESLLYSSSVDVTGQFNIGYCKEFFKLAAKIRSLNTDVLLENLELIHPEEIPFEDEHSNDIFKLFPEIIVSDLNV